MSATHPSDKDQRDTRAAATGNWSNLPPVSVGLDGAAGGFPIPPGPPVTQVGPYRIVRSLGHGGMGEVYLAEQPEPKRNVAVKLIRAGHYSKEALARFRREPRFLARLNHPNVATVHEVGVSENGQPYLVMEYVDGLPLTKYCQTSGLSRRERLDLFLQACDAVQHAHQKGVIHRDLKPSNVLAFARDAGHKETRHSVKVIDFGIARSIEPAETEGTQLSRWGQPLGTIEYMAPEQTDRCADVDVRADLYSLGMVLFELLTNETPFDWTALHNQGESAILRAVRETAPRRPSQVDPALRGDLEWIILRALEKAPAERYQSVTELSRNIRRHLNHEPVDAGPQSQWYRLRKFWRRNPTIVAVAVAAMIATPIMTGLYAYARSESQKKSAESLKYRSVNEVLTMMIEAPDALKMGENTRVSDAVKALSLWLHDGNIDPAVASEVYPVLGRALALHASAAEALEFLNRAQDSAILSPGTKAALKLLSTSPLIRANRLPEAEAVFEAHLSANGSTATESEALLNSLATAAHLLVEAPRPGSVSTVKKLLQRALVQDVRGAPHAWRARARAQHALAICQFIEGSPSEALASVRLALKRPEDGQTPSYDSVTAAGDELFLRARLGEHAAAVEGFAQLIERTQALFGRNHFAVGQLFVQLGEICAMQRGQTHQAAEAMREGHRILREKLGPDSYLTAQAARSLAALVGSGLHSAEALDLVREALPVYERELGAQDARTLELWAAYVGMLYAQRATLPDAALEARNALSAARRTYGREHVRTLEAMKILRMILIEGEHTEELVRLCKEEVESRARLERDPEFLYASHMLATALLERDDPAAAVEACARAASWLRDRNMTNWHNWIAILRPHAKALVRLGRFGEAEALLADAARRVESAEETHRDSAAFRVGVARDLVDLYQSWCRARPTAECAEKLRLAEERLRPLQATTPTATP
ncbi:MAG: protein kinase [Phycisphaerae bacterium]